MNTLAAWLKNPNTENYKHKVTKKASAIFMGLIRATLLIGICYIILSPVFKIVSNAVMDPIDIYNPLVYLVPLNYTLDNFRHAFNLLNYIPNLTQTMGFTVGIAALQVLIPALVGYGFARFRFPGREVLFAMVIITIVVPIQTYMIPLYMNFRFFGAFGFETNLIGQYTPVVLLTLTGSGLRSGLYIYIFRQFFRGMPKEIEEAALIDGAGQGRTFLTIMLPNAGSAIITVIMFAMVWQYNDVFYISLFMTGRQFLATRLVALGTVFQIAEGVRDPKVAELVVNAGMVLMIAPIITLYLVMQRYFMESIERSGIVG
jgi:multiple sugar transport system permease protein